ncbi:MAG: M36 family metallopeptidase, partial [Rubricoccaceae bacterium]|nr:M36 family metallopeptidase [Rubricoccaceae bacterium]
DALALAWEVGLYERGAQHYWLAYVDAVTGGVRARHDLVVHDHFGEARATGAEALASLAPLAEETPTMAPLALVGAYRVYPAPVESPNHTAPPPPADARVLVADPDDAAASPYGWHDTDGAPGAEFTRTRGNNVHAYTDTNNDTNPDAGSDPDGGAGLLFDPPLDLTLQPSANRPPAVVNLFYWNNVFHDVMWHYGFDEPAGNFQVNNYGNGGLGGDDVRAEAQDGGGTCNANFFTPVDGQRPRMQMYISSGGVFGCNDNPIQRDGSLDNLVIIHEYGHGVSNRLVGGPSNVGCLSSFSTPEHMGEGWSDYYGLMMTMRPGDAGTDARGIGTWLFGQEADGPGIRDFPYSTDMGVNPQTYAYTRTAVVPHGVGSVWTTIVWEATWELIGAYGFDPDLYNFTGTSADAGNVAMMALVTTGMKLMPCSPGFVDARDAILAADQALYGGLHIDDLWAAFARRGLGIGADQGSSSTNSDNVEDFAEPEQIPPDPVTDLAAAPASLGVELTWTATGDDGSTGTADSYDIRYSTTGPITDDALFDAATQVDDEPDPQPSGTPESFTVTGLDFATTHWFAMKVSDNSFNTSDLSNSASATTLGPPVAQISTSPITVTTPPNTQATATFTIGNTGPSDLLYGIDFSETTASRRPAPVQTARAPRPATRGIEEPKEGPEPRGFAPELGSGGPDLFGYKWIDSDEPGGPAFSFVDIGDTGTAVPLSDDQLSGAIALPFAFPFYGVDYNEVYISSNGWLSFTPETSSHLGNDPIPDSGTPNAIIAMYWDDLDPGGALGDVLYQDMGDGRFVVQFDNVPHYPDGNGEVSTFQAILSQSGQVLLQYLAMTDDASSPNGHTIGIENADGTDGLEVVYNAPYVHDELAIRFSAIWVSADPASGAVAGGSSDAVELTFDATGLAEGTYTADMTVATNDPQQPLVVVPLVFTVGDPPQVTFDLTTETDPVIVAPGGVVDFTATLFVPEGGPSSLDYWSEATLPDNSTREVFGPGTILVSPGTYVRMLAQRVPRNAPPGDYTYTMKVGTYPDVVVAEDAFGLTVTPSVAGRAAAEGAEAWALFEHGALLEAGATRDLRRPEAEPAADAPAATASALPTEPALHAAYPNPFGTAATVRYDVPAPGATRVALYDLLGREVAVLADGPHDAGRFTVVLDGRGLPNGVYLVRMTTGGFSQTQRVTLLR